MNEDTSNEFVGFNAAFAHQFKARFLLDFQSERKRSLLRIGLFLLLFALITTALALIGYGLGQANLYRFPNQIPVSVWRVALLIVFLGVGAFLIHRTTSVLFFWPLPFKTKNAKAMLAKSLVCLIDHLFLCGLTLLPFILGYGIVTGANILFYFWAIVATVLLALVLFGASMLVSIVYVQFRRTANDYPALKGLCLFALLCGISLAIYGAVRTLPNDFDDPGVWTYYHLPRLMNSCADFLKKSPFFTFPSAIALGSANGVEFSLTGVGLHVLLSLGIAGGGSALGYLGCWAIYSSYAKDNGIKLPSFTVSKKRFHPVRDLCLVAFGSEEIDYQEMLYRFHRAKIYPATLENAMAFLKEAYPDLQFALVPYTGEPSIVLAGSKYQKELCVAVANKRMVHLYSPTHIVLTEPNRKSFTALLYKDLRLGLASKRATAKAFLLFIFLPAVTLVLNAFFASRAQTYANDKMTLVWNLTVIGAAAVLANLNATSIYSREGLALYRTILSPEPMSNVMAAKVMPRALIMGGSLVVSGLIYWQYCTLSFVTVPYVYVCLAGLTLGHFFFCCELDYLLPNMKKSGKRTALKITVAFLYGAFAAAAFHGLVRFFLDESTSKAFYSLMLITLLFMIGRFYLFVRRVACYDVAPFKKQ